MRALRFALLIVLSVAFASAAAMAGGITRHQSAQPLPALSFDTRDGVPRALADVAGDVIVLHVWATWCGTCRTEFPSLLKFQQAIAGRSVTLVTVSVDRLGWPMIDRTLKELNAETLPVFLDRNREIPAAVGAFGLPFSIIVDRRGREVARIVGASDWQSPEIAALIDAALKN